MECSERSIRWALSAVATLFLIVQVVYCAPATGPLRVSNQNPRYFSDPSGKVIYLAGSQSGGWDIQDDAWSGYAALGTRVSYDFNKFLNLLAAHRGNFIRLWTVETTLFDKGPRDMIATPVQFLRTGPGNALDGRPKFDLTKFDPAYYTRLRSAVANAGERGIYVMVMLFEGFSCVHAVGNGYANPKANPWIGHPFNVQNNINNINADLNGDGMGTEYHSLGSTAVVDLQKAYVRKVIDTVNDLDNVLYEIANESIPESKEWQYEIIRTIKQYESTKPKQHPVIMSEYWPGDSNPALFASPADGVAPTELFENPPAATGAKVILADQDHNNWKNEDPHYVWKNFLRGNNVIMFDRDVVPFDWDKGAVGHEDKSFEPIRWSVGYSRDYAEKMDLARMTPKNSLSSTGYCLANPASEYLAYQPGSGSFSLSLATGKYKYEWFNPSTGEIAARGQLTAAGGNEDFKPPFEGHAVLYLKAQPPGH